jgi:O-antigen/teichoic acid export membrane protein
MNPPAEASPAGARLNLRRLFALGGTRTGVLGLTTIGSLFVRTLSSMALTRLLRPSDFGIVGIIGSVFYTATMFTDLGFQGFLIRHERTDDPHFRNVLWTIHVKRGVALFLIVAAASPIISWIVDKPSMTLPLAVASATFAFEGLASLSLITALRRDKSRELSVLELALQIFQSTAAILLALWWRNAWAMIAAMVLQSAMRTFLSYRLFDDSSQAPARDPEIFREFLAWSRIVLVSSAFTLLIAQNQLILARLFSLQEFGLYSLAISIAMAPQRFATSYVTKVVFPLYASTWREWPAALGNVYYNVRRRASALYAFGCGGLIGGAPLLFALLYDPRYQSAALFMSIIMISGVLLLPNFAATELLTAIGDIRGTLRMNMVRLAWLAVAIPLGYLAIGTLGVVVAVGTIEVPAMLYCWLVLHRLRILRMREELLYLAITAAGVGIGFAVSTAAHRLFPLF